MDFIDSSLRQFHQKLIQYDTMHLANSLLTKAIAQEQLAIQFETSKQIEFGQNLFQNIPEFLMETSMDLPIDGEGWPKVKREMEESGEYLSGNSEKGAKGNEAMDSGKMGMPSLAWSPGSSSSASGTMDKLACSKAKFVWMMKEMEEERVRARQVLSHQKYAEYVEKLRKMRISGSCNYWETRIANRFVLDETGEILLDRKNKKPYLCYEDMFDSIHCCYLRPRYGGLRAVYAELKRDYANITMECVNMYLKACGYDLKVRNAAHANWREEEDDGKGDDD